MNYILFDSSARFNLFPFTHTRPVADIRCGIMTMRERWEHFLAQQTSTFSESYLQKVFPLKAENANLLINSSVFVNAELVAAINEMKQGEQLVKGELVIAANVSDVNFSYEELGSKLATLQSKEYGSTVHAINHTWDIFSQNDRAIREDFATLTAGRKSAAIPEHVTVTGKDIFIEEGAVINAGCIINTATGPVYIGKDAEVLEGTMIRGPLAMCDHAVIKMGGKVYGATTLGPGCKVGGEISNVVFFANSNKGHDGYLGNAVIGEWCNLGADTNCSNLKNNYDEVKVWDEHRKKVVKTGLTFCGLMMGDHSKAAINTMFNTGTIAGVSCNIFGGTFPESFIPSFSWGGSEGMTAYRIDRALDTAGRMMARRNKQLSEAEIEMYHHIFEKTREQRELFTHG